METLLKGEIRYEQAESVTITCMSCGAAYQSYGIPLYITRDGRREIGVDSQSDFMFFAKGHRATYQGRLMEWKLEKIIKFADNSHRNYAVSAMVKGRQVDCLPFMLC